MNRSISQPSVSAGSQEPSPTVDYGPLVAGYIFGIVFLAFAFWRLYSHRAPDGATKFTGTIIEEVTRKSSQTGRRKLMYAPRVAYQHPRTGRDEVFEPKGFNQNRFAVGERAELIYDPAKDRVFRPLDRPVKDTVVLVLVGVGFITAQFFAT